MEIPASAEFPCLSKPTVTPLSLMGTTNKAEETIWFLSEILPELPSAALRSRLEVRAWGEIWVWPLTQSPRRVWAGRNFKEHFIPCAGTSSLAQAAQSPIPAWSELLLCVCAHNNPHFPHFSVLISTTTSVWLSPFTHFLFWAWPKWIWNTFRGFWYLETRRWKSVSFAMLLTQSSRHGKNYPGMEGWSLRVCFSKKSPWKSSYQLY